MSNLFKKVFNERIQTQRSKLWVRSKSRNLSFVPSKVPSLILDEKIKSKLKFAEESAKLDFLDQNKSDQYLYQSSLFLKMWEQFKADCVRKKDAFQGWDKQTKDLLGILNVKVNCRIRGTSQDKNSFRAQSKEYFNQLYYEYLKTIPISKDSKNKKIVSFCDELDKYDQIVEVLNLSNVSRKNENLLKFQRECSMQNKVLGELKKKNKDFILDLFDLENYIIEFFFTEKETQSPFIFLNWLAKNEIQLNYLMHFIK